jgi:hypothetical protein
MAVASSTIQVFQLRPKQYTPLLAQPPLSLLSPPLPLLLLLLSHRAFYFLNVTPMGRPTDAFHQKDWPKSSCAVGQR